LGCGFGVLAPTPKPPNPNPQSPIPNGKENIIIFLNIFNLN